MPRQGKARYPRSQMLVFKDSVCVCGSRRKRKCKNEKENEKCHTKMQKQGKVKGEGRENVTFGRSGRKVWQEGRVVVKGRGGKAGRQEGWQKGREGARVGREWYGRVVGKGREEGKSV